MTLEILKHGGPARLGKLHLNGGKLATPNMFSVLTDAADVKHDIYITSSAMKTERKPLFVDWGSLSVFDERKFTPQNAILPDYHVGLSVPRELAEMSVSETLRFSEGYPDCGAVVQGSAFPDLREKCARGLGERPLFVVANGEKLVRRPRLLVEIVTSIREAIPPNSTLYFPTAPPHMFHILAYMGVDLFDSAECIMKARAGKMLTPKVLDLRDLKELPCACAICASRTPEDLLDFDLALAHNFNKAVEVLKEIREAIRVNALRELVEEKACGSVNAMAALRILDAEKGDFLERYTGVV
ncbi:MAG: tRNA-guanine transglycosylase [Candidatus Hydrothermarchaeaceae archaeon]